MWRASGAGNPALDAFVQCQVSLPPVGERNISDILLGAAFKPGLNLGCFELLTLSKPHMS